MGAEIIIALVGLFCTTVSSWVTFIFTRRKYNTEVESQHIENQNASFELYKKTMEESMAAQKQRFEETILSLNEKIEYLQKENDSLKSQLSTLQMQMIKYLGSVESTPKKKSKGSTDGDIDK